MYTDTDGELDTFGLLQPLIQVSHNSKNAQTSTYCSLGIVLVSLGIPKVHQETIPEQLGGMSIVALNNFGTHPLIRPYHVPVVFGIELGGEFGGVHQVTEHHRKLAAFSVSSGRSSGWRCSLSRCLQGRLGCVLGGGWRREGQCLSATHPDQHAAVFVPCDLLRVEEFILEGFKGVVIQVKLHLQCPIGHPFPALEHGYRLVEDLLKGHDQPSLYPSMR